MPTGTANGFDGRYLVIVVTISACREWDRSLVSPAFGMDRLG